jgi:hypothetical protein
LKKFEKIFKERKKRKKRYAFQGERHDLGKPLYTPIFAKIPLFLPETHKKEHYFSNLQTYLKKLCFSVIDIVPRWEVHGGSASRVCKSSAERKNDQNSAGTITG